MAILGPPRYIVAMAEASAPTPESDGAPDALGRWRPVHRAIAAALITVAVALNVGALSRGLEADDNVYTMLIGSHLQGRVQGPWYEIASLTNPDGPAGIARLIDEGFLPWWSDPQLKWALFRPAAVVTHFVDMMAWPDSPRAMHAHSLCWYAALLVSVAWLYRRCAHPVQVRGARLANVSALCALAFYAFNVTNGAVASWIATRNAIMSALFAVLAVGLHDLARRRGGRAGVLWLLLSCDALLLSLLSSEGGIAAWGYLVAYALWVDERPVAVRARALLPALGTTLLWIVSYRLLGFGTAAGGLYLDPLSEPLGFAAELPTRMAWLLRQLLGLPAGLQLPPAIHPTVDALLTGVGLLVLCGWSLVDRRMRFWVGGCIASLIPWCAGYPTSRMLLIPALGAFGALGHAVAAITLDRPRLLSRMRATLRPPAAAALLSLATVWVVLHVPVSAWLVPEVGREGQRIEHLLDRLSTQLPPDAPGRTMMLLNTPSFVFTLFATVYRADDPFAAHRAYTMGASDQPVHVSRPSEHSLRLSPVGGYLVEFTSRLPRSLRNPFAVGDRVTVGLAAVTVEQITDDGRPLTVRFDFEDLDDPALLWTSVHWEGLELGASPVTLPPVGGSLLLPAVRPR